MSGKVRMTVALEAEAAARLDELTTERKRGEYLSKLILAGDQEEDQGEDFGDEIAEAAGILQGLLARVRGGGNNACA